MDNLTLNISLIGILVFLIFVYCCHFYFSWREPLIEYALIDSEANWLNCEFFLNAHP